MAAPLNAAGVAAGERRDFRRVGGRGCHESIRLRLRPGRDAWLLNVSRSGACLEVSSRLLPGTPVEALFAMSDWQWVAMARVTRCHVAALTSEGGVRYRAALKFDRPMDSDCEKKVETFLASAQTGYQVPSHEGRSVPI